MSDVAGIFILIGRILFVIFPSYVSGYSFHLKSSKMAEGYAQSVGFPVPAVAGWPAGLWLVVASISVALGIWPDIGALMFAAFVIPAAWYFHRFWEIEDPTQKQAQTMFFYRNVMMLAASLIMFGFFAGVGDALRFSITGPLIDLTP
ncbi:MAG TPA: DoxX family protein [Actinomycetota bacterium]|nr:DoxX family protein [Actinomycetota bacterium]